MKKYSKAIGFIWVAILVIFDQITKVLASNYLKDGQPFPIIENVFSLHYLENTGAAFGLFKDQLFFFIIMTAVVLMVILYAYIKLPKTKRYIPLNYILIFITAGAIGNLIDRIVHNYVIDFFYFELINFPIFNVADCYVSISAVLLIVLFLFYYKEEDFNFLNFRKNEETNENE